MADLSLTFGESRILDVAVTDENGAAVDITGSSFWFTVKADYLDADADALMTFTVGSGITITDAANGLAEVKVVPADWSGISNEPQRLVWDLTEKDASNDVWRLADGYFIVGAAVQEVIA